jgi:hopanoid biosynthesis associated protein HpnK
LKKLIVTADDVGLHPGMTHGALAAADAGIVTAVSVAAVGRAFEPAVELLRDRPALDVGIHLTLVGERPLSPPEKIPSLVGRNGALLSGYPALARRFLLGGIAAREVEAELRRQIERLLATGLRLVHANAHQHLHVLPRVFEVVLRLAEEHGIPYVRIPCEPAVTDRWWPRTPRTAQLAVLNALGRRARRQLEPAGRVAAVERTLGIVDAGHLTVERLRGALRLATPGVSELVCHPGLGDADLSAAYAWDYDWDTETAALCDPGVPELLREEGIELTSFSQL